MKHVSFVVFALFGVAFVSTTGPVWAQGESDDSADTPQQPTEETPESTEEVPEDQGPTLPPAEPQAQADPAPNPAPQPDPAPKPAPKPTPKPKPVAGEGGTVAHFFLLGGLGHQSEDHLGKSSFADIEGRLHFDLNKGLSLSAGFRDRIYNKTLLGMGPGADGGPMMSTHLEQFQQVRVEFGINVLNTATSSVSLAPRLSLAYLHLANAAFPTWAGQLGLAVELGVHPVAGLDFLIGGRGAPVLFDREDTQSVMGHVKATWDLDALVRITPPNAPISAIVGYRATSLVQDRQPRAYHGVMMGMDITLNP